MERTAGRGKGGWGGRSNQITTAGTQLWLQLRGGSGQGRGALGTAAALSQQLGNRGGWRPAQGLGDRKGLSRPQGNSGGEGQAGTTLPFPSPIGIRPPSHRAQAIGAGASCHPVASTGLEPELCVLRGLLVGAVCVSVGLWANLFLPELEGALSNVLWTEKGQEMMSQQT